MVLLLLLLMMMMMMMMMMYCNFSVRYSVKETEEVLREAELNVEDLMTELMWSTSCSSQHYHTTNITAAGAESLITPSPPSSSAACDSVFQPTGNH